MPKSKKPVTIMAVENWPDIPGHAGETKTWTGKRKLVNSNGDYWLVKKDGLFQRYQWRPVKGLFVKLYRTK